MRYKNSWYGNGIQVQYMHVISMYFIAFVWLIYGHLY